MPDDCHHFRVPAFLLSIAKNANAEEVALWPSFISIHRPMAIRIRQKIEFRARPRDDDRGVSRSGTGVLHCSSRSDQRSLPSSDRLSWLFSACVFVVRGKKPKRNGCLTMELGISRSANQMERNLRNGHQGAEPHQPAASSDANERAEFHTKGAG